MKGILLAAVSHVLDRACRDRRILSEQEQEEHDTGEGAPRDPGLGYYLCPHTESWAKLVEAEAILLGKDAHEHEQYRADCWYGRGDPEAPYRGTDEPGEHHWSGALGYRWATDGQLMIREDSPRPPKARGHRWLNSDHFSGIEEIVPLRGRCTSEVVVGWEMPKNSHGLRLEAVRENGAELLWCAPRPGVAYDPPLICLFRTGERLPYALCAARRAE